MVNIFIQNKKQITKAASFMFKEYNTMMTGVPLFLFF